VTKKPSRNGPVQLDRSSKVGCGDGVLERPEIDAEYTGYEANLVARGADDAFPYLATEDVDRLREKATTCIRGVLRPEERDELLAADQPSTRRREQREQREPASVSGSTPHRHVVPLQRRPSKKLQPEHGATGLRRG